MHCLTIKKNAYCWAIFNINILWVVAHTCTHSVSQRYTEAFVCSDAPIEYMCITHYLTKCPPPSPRTCSEVLRHVSEPCK